MVFRSSASASNGKTSSSYLMGSALYSTSSSDAKSVYDGSTHVYEYDDSVSEYDDGNEPIEDIDLYPEESSYFLPAMSFNLLKTYERCDENLHFGSVSRYRQIDIGARPETIACNTARGYLVVNKGLLLRTDNHFVRLLSFIGEGTFGQTFLARDVVNGAYFAVKILRSFPDFVEQGQREKAVLDWVNAMDEEDNYNLIHLAGYGLYRNHHVLVFPRYFCSLKEFMDNNSQGLSLRAIRSIAHSILTSLSLLHSNGIIHTDVKPHNLLFEYPFCKGDSPEETERRILNNRIRLIDLSSCNNDYPKPSATCQSLYWRSPEVVLQLPYDTKIDVWSLGVVLLELFLGYTAFPGQNEFELLHLVHRRVGSIPQSMVMRSTRQTEFFHLVAGSQLYQLRPLSPERSATLLDGKATLSRVVHDKPFPLSTPVEQCQTELRERDRFFALLTRMVCVDPVDRAPVETLLTFPFITGTDNEPSVVFRGQPASSVPDLRPRRFEPVPQVRPRMNLADRKPYGDALLQRSSGNSPSGEQTFYSLHGDDRTATIPESTSFSASFTRESYWDCRSRGTSSERRK